MILIYSPNINIKMWVLTLKISVYLLDPTPYVEIMIGLQP